MPYAFNTICTANIFKNFLIVPLKTTLFVKNLSLDLYLIPGTRPNFYSFPVCPCPILIGQTPRAYRKLVSGPDTTEPLVCGIPLGEKQSKPLSAHTSVNLLSVLLYI
jgi:hypothetical protein